MGKGNIGKGISGKGCKCWKSGFNIKWLTLECKVFVEYGSFVLEIGNIFIIFENWGDVSNFFLLERRLYADQNVFDLWRDHKFSC